MQSANFEPVRPREPGSGRVASGADEYEPARMPGDLHTVYEHPEKAGHPDGVPHDIALRTAFGAVVTALVGGFAYLMFGLVVGIIAAVVTLWLVLRGVPKKAQRERTEEAAVEALAPHPPGRVTDEPRGDDNA